MTNFKIINPVALGKGLSIFKNLTNLKMVNATPFKCGVIVSHYINDNQKVLLKQEQAK